MNEELLVPSSSSISATALAAAGEDGNGWTQQKSRSLNVPAQEKENVSGLDNTVSYKETEELVHRESIASKKSELKGKL